MELEPLFNRNYASVSYRFRVIASYWLLLWLRSLALVTAWSIVWCLHVPIAVSIQYWHVTDRQTHTVTHVCVYA